MAREFDKLNASYKQRAIPYETYFGEMEISEVQKKERIEAAERFEDDMFFFFLLISMLYENGYENYSDAVGQFIGRYSENARRFIADEGFLSWYPTILANEMLETTLENIDNPWFLSNDRAMFNAENEANTILNRSDYVKAILTGKKYKTWVDMKDKRVRRTHTLVGGKTIPITDLFSVGDALMRFPHDYEMASDFPEELIHCRCSIVYR